ncbi:MAG: right-handed parallel beta-helix repeat-containing protein [Chitinophagaceae bacterium]
MSVSYEKDTLFADFAEGIYSLKESITFSNKEGSKASGPVVITGKGQVIFSGGETLDNRFFAPVSDNSIKERIISEAAKSRVLVYDLSKNASLDLDSITSIGFGRKFNLAAPPQLFYNGQRLTLARYPNAGDPALLKNRSTVIPINKIIDPGKKAFSSLLEQDGKMIESIGFPVFEYSDNRAKHWLRADDLWLDGIFARDWAWSLNKIKHIDTLAHSITLLDKEKYDLTTDNSFFFACNLIEEIDMPGEYYIDRKTGKLYLYPPIDFNPAFSKLQLSAATFNLFNLAGVSNIRFTNICFELSRLNAVNVARSHHIQFVNCIFRNIGNSAIVINGNDNRIENCHIYGIGATAISLEGGDFKTLTKSNNTVAHCSISDWAYYNRVYTPAIALKGVGNMVSKNKLFNAPHGAITISGNDHVIEGNEIHDVLQEFKDFGAIYGFLGSDQLMRGHVIRGNYFHDIGLIGDAVYAIYADECTSGWLIENNLFYNIGNKGARVAAIISNTGYDLSIRNNLFLDCSETFELSFHFTTWAKKKYPGFAKTWQEKYGKADGIPIPYLDRYPALQSFMKADKIYVNSNSFTGNTIGNFGNPIGHKNYFLTRSDKENTDSLVDSHGNQFTSDDSLPYFLKNWNKTRNMEKSGLVSPAMLKPYLDALN